MVKAYNKQFLTGGQRALSNGPERTTQKGEAQSSAGKDEEKHDIDLGCADAKECIHAGHHNREEGKTGIIRRLLRAVGEASRFGVGGGRRVERVKGARERKKNGTCINHHQHEKQLDGLHELQRTVCGKYGESKRVSEEEFQDAAYKTQWAADKVVYGTVASIS